MIAKLTTARWITFQSRCLRLYITGTVPQEHADFLEILVTYIVKVYAPVRISRNSSYQYHIYNIRILLIILTESVLEIRPPSCYEKVYWIIFLF